MYGLRENALKSTFESLLRHTRAAGQSLSSLLSQRTDSEVVVCRDMVKIKDTVALHLHVAHATLVFICSMDIVQLKGVIYVNFEEIG